jgi:predicted MFS family arabinose efflux permease
MMLVPAAMFSMFFFLSLFIQNLVGYSPLRTGFAFLPFSVGIVIGAGVSSSLVNRIDARFIAGTGTVLAAIALFGFSRLSIDESPAHLLSALSGGTPVGADVNYWTSILPFIVIMSIGMGLTFVPLTLTAVHHVRSEDSGIGSGVLNTMQQVGGALGLATLSTVSLHFTSNRAAELGPQLAEAAQKMGVPGDKIQSLVNGATYLGAYTDGATKAFLVGSAMILLGSLVVWLFLDVKHDELATDGPEGVHVG